MFHKSLIDSMKVKVSKDYSLSLLCQAGRDAQGSLSSVLAPEKNIRDDLCWS